MSAGENMNLLFNSHIVNLLLKISGGEVEDLILLFCSLECLNCWQIDSGGMKQKVMFRSG